MSPDDPLLGYLAGIAGPIPVDRIPLDTPAVRALREAGISLVVPLVTSGELVGVLSLGPRRSEREYSTDDRRLLAGPGRATPRRPSAWRSWSASRRPRPSPASGSSRSCTSRSSSSSSSCPRSCPTCPAGTSPRTTSPAREVGGDFYDFIALPDGRRRGRHRRRHRQGRAGRAGHGDAPTASCGPRRPGWSPRATSCGGSTTLLMRGDPAAHVRHLPVRGPRPGHRAAASSPTPATTCRTCAPPTGVVELRATGHAARADARHGATRRRRSCSSPASSVLLHSDGLVEAHDARPGDVRLPAAPAAGRRAGHRRGADRPGALTELEPVHRARAGSRRTTSPWSPSRACRRTPGSDQVPPTRPCRCPRDARVLAAFEVASEPGERAPGAAAARRGHRAAGAAEGAGGTR